MAIKNKFKRDKDNSSYEIMKIESLSPSYRAEEYHQRHWENNVSVLPCQYGLLQEARNG
jgi:peptide methionine sulfoxide reductase MsrA